MEVIRTSFGLQISNGNTLEDLSGSFEFAGASFNGVVGLNSDAFVGHNASGQRIEGGSLAFGIPKFSGSP